MISCVRVRKRPASASGGYRLRSSALRHAVWIDLQEATPDEINPVQSATDLKVPSEAEISEIETSSRLASRDGVLYLSMPLIGYRMTAPEPFRSGSCSARIG